MIHMLRVWTGAVLLGLAWRVIPRDVLPVMGRAFSTLPGVGVSVPEETGEQQ